MKTFNKEYFRSAATKARRKRGVPSREELRHRHQVQFINDSIITHSNKYCYDRVEYKTSTTKVTIRCQHHGEFSQSPSAHRRGQGCPTCGQSARTKSITTRTHEGFVEEANRVHESFYLYPANYISVNKKLSIRCPTHGMFDQTPKAHLRGQGCPICANEKRSQFFESKGERAVEAWLIENGIEYTKQQMFDGCVDLQPLRFDFYLPQQNRLIEFDGEQHYKFIPRFHTNEEGFDRMKNRDAIKNEFANKHNIQLTRIRWDEQTNIPAILEQACLLN